MLFIPFNEAEFDTVLLCSPNTFKTDKLKKHYVDHLIGKEVVAVSLAYNSDNKAPVKEVAKPFIEELLQQLEENSADLIIVNDAHYFKVLTKQKKVTHLQGQLFDCAFKDSEHIKVAYIPSFSNSYYDPSVLDTIKDAINKLLGNDVDTSNYLVKTYYKHQVQDITDALAALMKYPELTLDIEGFSLNFYEAAIGTFSFGVSDEFAIAVQCDYEEIKGATEAPYGKYVPCKEVRGILLRFLLAYEGELILHNCYYDLESIIFFLFMEEKWSAVEEMKDACTYFGKKCHDTKLIAYLALNSVNRPKLDLKTLAYPHMGNYGIDVTDICTIPLDELLEYNGKDAIATWYVFNTYYTKMVNDNQLDVYNKLYKGGIALYLEIEMSGLPLDPKVVQEVSTTLIAMQESYLKNVLTSPVIIDFTDSLRQVESIKQHEKWKVKTAPIEHFDFVQFNPGSAIQLSKLLYEKMELPVLDYTKAGNPSTKAKVLEKLLNVCVDQEDIDCLTNILRHKELATIVNTFINAFNNKVVDKGDGRVYLHSSFNQAGTVSGRLSSAKVNLQNIPSTGTIHAKLIKSCISAAWGKVFCGADFKSLEDRISALTTKDPNKLQVYTDLFDGHCLRAYAYFPEKMPDIDPTSVESINSIADKYPQIRQDSKAPTFLLTYKGTSYGLIKNIGLPEETALAIEKAYHELYKVSDAWVNEKIALACKQGYIDVAFGLRIRCPALKGIDPTKKLSAKVEKITRTIANALGQSYGMLNTYAGIQLRERLIESPYKLDIMLSPHIHDAQYFCATEEVDVIRWLNDNVVDVMNWQDLPEIQHETVTLGGELDLFYPAWDKSITLPNSATELDILTMCQAHSKKLKEDK